MPEVISRDDARALGLKRYFTGEPCCHGHTVERFVSTSGCIACLVIQKAEWNSLHPDWHLKPHRKEYAREYFRKHYIPRERNADSIIKKAKADGSKTYETGRPCKRGHIAPRLVSNRKCCQCGLDDNKTWRIKNKEYVSQKSKQWHQDNKKYCYEYKKKKNDEEPEVAKRQWAEWYAKNRIQEIAKSAKARFLRISVEGSFTSDDIKRILILQRNKCANPRCRKSIKIKSYHVDHIVPLFLGGTNYPKNLQILCAKCNLSKGCKDPIDFAQRNGLLI